MLEISAELFRAHSFTLGQIVSPQEKLAVAAREIEDQMEEYDFGTDDDDDDEEENPFGDREEATGLLADV